MLASSLVFGTSSFAGEWAPAGDHIKTQWAAKVSPADCHPEYPRPQMVRSEWMSMNGLWNYAIKPIGETSPSVIDDGRILVPFAV